MIAPSLRLLATLSLALACSGCTTWGVLIDFDEGYEPGPAIDVEVGDVKNETGQDFDFDVEKAWAGRLEGALNRSLSKRDRSRPPRQLRLHTQIVEYRPGNAFQRWLIPGWGSAVLRVHGNLEDVEARDIVARIDVRKRVSSGGLLTVGAWEHVFELTAVAVANKIREDHGIEYTGYESTHQGRSGPKGRLPGSR